MTRVKLTNGLFLIVLLLGYTQENFGQTRDECMECHQDKDLTKEDEKSNQVSLFVDMAVFSKSVHGEFECADCHADIEALPHEEKLQKVDCGLCHEDAVTALAASVHGDQLRTKSLDAPGCSQCHGTHEIMPVNDPASMMSKHNQAATCGTCHANAVIVERNDIPIKNPVALYDLSIHGQLVLKGNAAAAVCSDCHGGHNSLRAIDPNSSIYKLNIPQTCSKCHEEIYKEYMSGVHAEALLQGAVEAPVCTNCHGEHEILRAKSPEAPTSGYRVATEVCSPCHASERLNRKYGLSPGRVQSFADSYHGLALRGGKAAVANCGSCHGVHDVLASSDPRSPVNPANIAKTCGQCHPNAGENFAKGKVHLIGESQEAKVARIVRVIYIIIIVLTIFLMVIHNVVDFSAKIRKIRTSA